MNKEQEQLPETIYCHCDHIAKSYYRRSFVNQLGYDVHRIFYRCTNCGSETPKDYIPDMSDKNVNVLDLLKNPNLLNRTPTKSKK